MQVALESDNCGHNAPQQMTVREDRGAVSVEDGRDDVFHRLGVHLLLRGLSSVTVSMQ